MKLDSLAYSLRLARPLQLGDELHDARRGWVLRRPRKEGGYSYADVCPLPAFSRESHIDVEAALDGDGTCPPSLTWALDALGHDDAAQASVRTARLWVAAGDDVEGFASLKLKVGRAALDEECALVERLARTGVRLRLDGNRALDLAVLERLAQAAGEALEFFEEPVPPALLAEALARAPVALDESLVDAPNPPAGAVAWVLKPTLLGARRTRELVAEAARTGVTTIVSSAYESAVGRRALVRFALAIAPDVTHGLDTAAAFAEDFPGAVEARGETLVAAGALSIAPAAAWRPFELEEGACTGC